MYNIYICINLASLVVRSTWKKFGDDGDRRINIDETFVSLKYDLFIAMLTIEALELNIFWHPNRARVSVSLREEASVLNPSNFPTLVPGLSKAHKHQIKMICSWVKFIAFKTPIRYRFFILRNYYWIRFIHFLRRRIDRMKNCEIFRYNIFVLRERKINLFFIYIYANVRVAN